MLMVAGVISGIGKGVIGMSESLCTRQVESINAFAASSTGLLLKTIGLKVRVPQKRVSCAGRLSADAGFLH